MGPEHCFPFGVRQANGAASQTRVVTSKAFRERLAKEDTQPGQQQEAHCAVTWFAEMGGTILPYPRTWPGTVTYWLHREIITLCVANCHCALDLIPDEH